TTHVAAYGWGGPGTAWHAICGLAVPRKFLAPNTQQWYLTLQRELGKNWVLELGYVGTHSLHLRETRTSLQPQHASAANPVVLNDANGTPFTITTNTFSNAPARSRAAGINGYNGMQLFADAAYSQ